MPLIVAILAGHVQIAKNYSFGRRQANKFYDYEAVASFPESLSMQQLADKQSRVWCVCVCVCVCICVCEHRSQVYNSYPTE